MSILSSEPVGLRLFIHGSAIPPPFSTPPSLPKAQTGPEEPFSIESQTFEPAHERVSSPEDPNFLAPTPSIAPSAGPTTSGVLYQADHPLGIPQESEPVPVVSYALPMYKPPPLLPVVVFHPPKPIYLKGSAKGDTLRGGRLSDTLRGEGGNDVLMGMEGKDLLLGGKGRDSLHGGADHDLLYGEEDDDQLWGQEGRDTLNVGAGNDRIRGGVDQDWLSGGSGDDFLYGEQGNDTLYGGSGHDQLLGGAGDDRLDGEKGNDLLAGEQSSDALNGGEGKDTLLGGDGNERLYGGDHEDRLRGDAGRDSLYGGRGRDRLDGGSGDDRLYGEGEEDTLFGGEGHDFLHGGTGNDALHGEAGQDVLYGAFGNDALFGGEGADRLFGDEGRDRLDGGIGHDELHGGEGGDQLYGGSGHDWLQGPHLYVTHRERDELRGGTGNDTFVLGTMAGHFYRDRGNGKGLESFAQVQDFERGSDRLRLFGQRSDYFTQTRRFGKTEGQMLYFDSNRSGHLDAKDDAIAFFSGVSALQVSGLFQRASFLGGIMPVNYRPQVPPYRAPQFVMSALDRGLSQNRQTVTVSFDRYDKSLISNETSVRSLSDYGKSAMRQILAHVSEFTHLRFVEVTGKTADLMVTQAQLGASAGRAYYPRKNGGSNLYLDQEYADNASLSPGGYGRKVLIHELGHVLGLKHPHDGFALPSLYNSLNQTVMSYQFPTAHHAGGQVVGHQMPSSFQLFDMAALQAKYGANINTRSGNTTYVVDPTRSVVSTFWDGCGQDWLTIRASNASYSRDHGVAVLDLREGPSFVTKVGKSAHWIAYGAKLEHARGGPGMDRLYGNFHDNRLVGGGGNDTLRGVELTRYGRWERDSLTGGSGRDRFVLGDTHRRYYDDGKIGRPGLEDYAVITDFNPKEDRLQLNGKSSQYLLGKASAHGLSGKTVVFDTNRNREWDANDELIAVLQSSASLNFSNTLGATSLAVYV